MVRLRRVSQLRLFMSLQTFFFDRVIAEICQQMDGVLALTEQLARQRLSPDAEACVSGVAESATGERRMIESAPHPGKGATGSLALPPSPPDLPAPGHDGAHT